MTFDEVLKDLERLVGKDLASIRPGAEVRLTKIDIAKGQLELETKKGELKTRSLSELKLIWEALQRKPAVHVEKILNGSGSSRNQPETILANLPYIEYLYDRVKHLAFVGASTHELGTLKEMDPVKTEAIRQRLRAQSLAVGTLIVTTDLQSACKGLEQLTGLPLQPLAMNIYRLQWENGQVLLAHPTALGGLVQAGTYPVIPTHVVPHDAVSVRAGELDLHITESFSVKLALVSK